jgi:outer membrane protein assembly factor BamB
MWKKSFTTDFGGQAPNWGYSESPLVDGDVVVCTPGADEALVVALDKSTGETLWRTKAPDEMQSNGHGGAGYSSIVIGHGAGIRQYVQLVGNGVIGISTADGSPLWGYDRIANGVANIPTPIVHEDYVFASTGYGAGAALLRLEPTASGVKVNEVYFHPGNKVQNHHGGMVLVDGHVYLGHGHNQGRPMCIELLTGKIKWGPVRGPGTDSAAVLYADGHLYFRYQNAVMALIEATPEAYRLKASFTLPSHLDNSWPHPVISDGRLYLRDQDVLLCYDLSARP